MRARQKRFFAALIAACLMATAWVLARPYLRATALILSVVQVDGRLGRAAAWVNHAAVTEAELAIPTRHGAVRGRSYSPGTRTGRAIAIVPGVNPWGIDEPRLVQFGRALGRAGVTAVTIEPSDLTQYRITVDDTERIEDAAVWLASRDDLTGGRPFGLVGMSFAGGLVLVSSGRPSLKAHLAFVVSFGGYGDLQRVVRFLCLGERPDGTHERPHDYGVVVLLLNVLDRLVPPAQVAPLRQAVLTFMDASWQDVTDPVAARRTFERARALQATLGEPAATIMRWVNDRDVETAGPHLLPYVLQMASNPALSPERSPATDGPVYLLHGDRDNVIPTQESERLASFLAPHARVRLLVTPLLTHVETEQNWGLGDAWALLRFWAAALRE